MRQRSRARGFTLFELAVSVALIALLIGVFLQRAAMVQEQAERAAVAQTVASLRVAMAVRLERLRQLRPGRAAEVLAAENPMTWLSEPPQNYLGEYYSAERQKIPGGNWVFDRRDKTLVYFPTKPKSFSSDASTLLKFKVKSPYVPRGEMVADPATEQAGIVLEQVGGKPLDLLR